MNQLSSMKILAIGCAAGPVLKLTAADCQDAKAGDRNQKRRKRCLGIASSRDWRDLKSLEALLSIFPQPLPLFFLRRIITISSTVTILHWHPFNILDP